MQTSAVPVYHNLSEEKPFCFLLCDISYVGIGDTFNFEDIYYRVTARIHGIVIARKVLTMTRTHG